MTERPDAPDTNPTEISVSVERGSVPETATVLNSEWKLKERFNDVVPELRLEVAGPGLLKIETGSPMRFATSVILVFLAILLIMVMRSCTTGRGGIIFMGFINSWQEFLSSVAAILAAALICGLIITRYRFSYLINLHRKQILLRKEAFGRIFDRISGEFSEVAFVAVRAKRIPSEDTSSSLDSPPRYDGLYDYVIVLADGRTLSAPGTTVSYEAAVRGARVVAELLDAPLKEGEPRKKLRIIEPSRGGRAYADYVHPDKNRRRRK